MMLEYESHILSYVEHHTSAIYHASDSILAPLDKTQTTFVHGLCLTEEEVFLEYNLAPLSLRRDIAILGLLHKCALQDAHTTRSSNF